MHLLAVAVLLSTMTSCKSEQKIQTAWVGNPITVDGSAEDWREIPSGMLSEQIASLSFGNDQDNLYILFKANDMKRVRTIKAAGITLYFNIPSGSSEDIYIRYKDGPKAEGMMFRRSQPGDSSREAPPEFGDRMRQREDQPPSFACCVKDRIVEKPIPMDGRDHHGRPVASGIYFYRLTTDNFVSTKKMMLLK